MATTTLTGTQFGAYEITLTASTVDKVVFPSQVSTVEVVNHDATSNIYVRFDSTDPVVKAAATLLVPAGTFRTVNVRGADPTADATEVRLISSGAPTYSVSRVP